MTNRFSNRFSPRTLISLANASRTGLRTACVATACIAAGVLSGCADPELEKQLKFEREYFTVANAYVATVTGNTTLLSDQPPAESLSALRAIAEQAKGISGGTAAQQESAQQLAGSIYRVAGAIELARASRLESEQELLRSVAIGASGLASDLEAIATAAETIDLASARSEPQVDKDAASRDARELQESVRGIERPLGKLVDKISSSNARVSQLDQEAALLLRKARESSPAAGFAFVEEAAKIQADARAERKDLSTNEIDAVEQKSQLELARVNLNSAEALLSAANNALEFVSNFEAEVDGQAAKCRAMATELRNTASGLLKSITEERDGALKAAYDAAAADFANAANGIGSGPAAETLRTTLMCEELRLKSSTIFGLGAQGRMLMLTGGASAAGLSDLKAAAESAIAALKEQAATASDAMASVGDDPTAGDAVVSLKSYVDGMKKMADGLSVDTLLTPPTPVSVSTTSSTASAGGTGKNSAAASSGRSMAGAGNGISDIEAWVAETNSIIESNPGEAAKRMADAMDGSTAAGKAMKDMSLQMAAVMAPLYDAMLEKFGSAKLDMASGGAGGGAGAGMSAISGGGASLLELASNDGSRAVFNDETGIEVVFAKGPNGWTLDMSGMLGQLGMSEEQLEQMAPMMTMAMAPMMNAMKSGVKEISDKIRSGEIATSEEVGAALQAAMTKGIGGAMGGTMGGTGRGARGGAGRGPGSGSGSGSGEK